MSCLTTYKIFLISPAFPQIGLEKCLLFKEIVCFSEEKKNRTELFIVELSIKWQMNIW